MLLIKICFYAFILIKAVKCPYFLFQSFKLNRLTVLSAYYLRKGFNFWEKKEFIIFVCSCVLAADPTHIPHKNPEQWNSGSWVLLFTHLNVVAKHPVEVSTSPAQQLHWNQTNVLVCFSPCCTFGLKKRSFRTWGDRSLITLSPSGHPDWSVLGTDHFIWSLDFTAKTLYQSRAGAVFGQQFTLQSPLTGAETKKLNFP